MNFSLQSEFRPRFKSTEPDLLLDERSIFLYHFAKGLSFLFLSSSPANWSDFSVFHRTECLENQSGSMLNGKKFRWRKK